MTVEQGDDSSGKNVWDAPWMRAGEYLASLKEDIGAVSKGTECPATP